MRFVYKRLNLTIAGSLLQVQFVPKLCNVVANALNLPAALQRCSKGQFFFREGCYAVANAKNFSGALATALQPPKNSRARLLQRCKGKLIFSGFATA